MFEFYFEDIKRIQTDTQSVLGRGHINWIISSFDKKNDENVMSSRFNTMIFGMDKYLIASVQDA